MTKSRKRANERLAILGGGNIGRALARGLVSAGRFAPEAVTVTRRQVEKLADLAGAGFDVTDDNVAAVGSADTVVIAVQPQQLAHLLETIAPALDPGRHHVISVVSGVSIAEIADVLGKGMAVVRAMPNTAVEIGESMTCLSGEDGNATLERSRELFAAVGSTLVIPENMMIPATALCACGVAFFLRSIRAASQGGIEIGFHPEEALLLAAQTARGAAALMLAEESHPESQIDRVTTPRGCTIAGLNEMEHRGFSSAMIKGILVSSRKAATLYGSHDGPVEP
jgi:pyrroline-5-carboxylate reductase